MSESIAFSRDAMAHAIRLACENVERGGRPYGAVILRGSDTIATGVNRLVETNDPTEHAELDPIRAATRALGTPTLTGCDAYASGQPCPMCLAALRLAGVRAIFFAYANEESEPFGFTTAPLYRELAKPLAEQSIPIRHGGADAWPDNPFERFVRSTSRG
jgi:tRNA(Arg) A34 adenosine deaminase TadA